MNGLYKISNAINSKVALLDFTELAILAPADKTAAIKINVDTAGWRMLDKAAGLLRKSMTNDELVFAAKSATRINVFNMLNQELESRKNGNGK